MHRVRHTVISGQATKITKNHKEIFVIFVFFVAKPSCSSWLCCFRRQSLKTVSLRE